MTNPDLTIPNNIVLHVGTNDIRDGKSTEIIMESAKKTVQVILNRNSEARVTISSVIPRGDDVMHDMERQELNLRLLKWSHDEENMHFIDNTNLSLRGKINDKLYAGDKVHLNPEGAKFLISNFSFNLKEQLGISNPCMNQQSQVQKRGFRRGGRRGSSYNNIPRQRSWSPS